MAAAMARAGLFGGAGTRVALWRPARSVPVAPLHATAALAPAPALWRYQQGGLRPQPRGPRPPARVRAVALSTTPAAAPADAARLAALRALLARPPLQADAFLVPAEDPHASEYTSPHHQRRAFVSGFTGSAGIALVTADAALLWTDGRYFTQAAAELPAGWTLMKAGMPGVPELPAWLAKSLPAGARVAIDPTLHSAAAARALQAALTAGGHTLVAVGANPVDELWGDARPAAAAAPVRLHPAAWAGEAVASKLARVRAELASAQAGGCLLTVLDDVGWLFNIRGGDVPCCPVAHAYAYVDAASARLYIDGCKLAAGGEAESMLRAEGVDVRPYEAAAADVAAEARAGVRIMIDPARASWAMAAAAAGQEPGQAAAAPTAAQQSPTRGPLEAPSIVTRLKAIKNSAELAGMREAHLRDAAALVTFFAWLEPAVAAAAAGIGPVVTEVSLARRLEGCRAAQEGFVGPSFDTIAGVGPHGAIVHYRASDASDAELRPGGLLLLDSGGQYDCGTTDVTRTVLMAPAAAASAVDADGSPPLDLAAARSAFTRVLQGHIALDCAVFPEGIPGFVLDVLARQALWRAGQDYRHGTGHGVGAALLVHEGPQGIAPRYNNPTGLAAGMILSIEPGYYSEGQFGIRVENLAAVAEADTPHRFGGTRFLRFERLTMVPIQAALLDRSLLSAAELEWIDAYHAQARQGKGR